MAINDRQGDLARDAQIIACDGIHEMARLMCGHSVALMEASAKVDAAEVEARLWALRQILKASISAWREAVPPIQTAELADG